MSTDPNVPWLVQLPAPTDRPPAPASSTGALPNDTLGLAVGGSGPGAAAFALGVIQALARSGWLRWIDLLSTTSTGGHAGAFLGRLFDQCRRPDGLFGAIPNPTPGAAQARAVRNLADTRSGPLRWLRRTADYTAPASADAAAVWRNVLSLYVVLGVFGFAVLACAAGVGYASGGGYSAYGVYGESGSGVFAALTPATGGWGGPLGPWVWLAELLFWFAIGPLGLAYWVVSEDQFEGFVAPVLVAAAVVAIGLLPAASAVGVAVVAAGVVWVFAAWRAVRRSAGQRNMNNPSRRRLTRNLLSRWLGVWVGVAAAVAGLAAVDAAGRLVAVRAIVLGDSLAGWLLPLAAGGVVLAVAVRTAARTGRPRTAVTVAVFGVVVAAVGLSAAAHAAFGGGAAIVRGAAVTTGAVVVGLLLGTPAAVPFVNRSGTLAAHAGRIARAYFGAVNPARRTHPDGEKVTHAVPGDDVTLAEYAPHAAGGPLHLINCAVGDTVDAASGRRHGGRAAVGLAIGPAGVTIGSEHHALWSGEALVPLDTPGNPNPFATAEGGPVPVEPLDLRMLVAVSGGGGSPATGAGGALLATLANDRPGYWWDSGRAARRSVVGWLVRVFRTQSLLLAEAAGRFAGPWGRFWHLSDGRAVDPTGAFELLRRRVPFVVACDGGTDSSVPGENFARLVRQARIELGAEIEEANADDLVPAAVAPYVGRTATAGLFLVRYPDGPASGFADPWHSRRYTWLLYIRPVLTGAEPDDIRAYAAAHPGFPVGAGPPSEAGWESHRALGAGAGGRLFVTLAPRAG